MIIPAIALHTFQQYHKIRLSLFGVLLFFVFVSAQNQGDVPLVGLTPLFVWVLGAGIIGRDFSSGVAHLLFTRPITRPSYILTKWLALTASVWALQLLVVFFWSFGNAYYHGLPTYGPSFFGTLCVSLWMAATLSSVVILFSTILSGLGDIFLLMYVHIVLGVCGLYALATQDEGFKGLVLKVFYVVWPGLALGFGLKDGGTPALPDFALGSCLAAVYITAAILVLARKDIGYTAD